MKIRNFCFHKLFLSLFFIFGLFFLGDKFVSAVDDLTSYCTETYQKQGMCPEELCSVGCADGVNTAGCEMGCRAKSCFEIDAQNCPQDSCRVLMGCEEKDICFPPPEFEEPACGKLGYVGAVECCEGLTKRCGVEFFDGSCDMVGENSEYAVAICIPCGNGICNQFEDRCNCPEDCG